MNQPVRLQKKEQKTSSSVFDFIMNKVEAWVLSHATLCLFVLMAILIALFVVLMFAIVGISATDSGVQYNQFNNIV